MDKQKPAKAVALRVFELVPVFRVNILTSGPNRWTELL